jgi:large subunit ribosomal protein L28
MFLQFLKKFFINLIFFIISLTKGEKMSKKCQITGKKSIFGNKKSHALNSTKRKFKINLKNHKFWISKKKKFIKLKLSTHAIRTINKKSIEKVLKKISYKK